MQKGKIIRQLLAKIFCVHFGGIFQHDGDPALKNTNRVISGITPSLRIIDSGGFDFDIERCLLVLTHISEITNEHLFQTAQLSGWFTPQGKDVGYEYFENSIGQKVIKIIGFVGKSSYTLEYVLEVDKLTYAQADFLRSKSYAIPYEGIDLFKADIAITPKQANA